MLIQTQADARIALQSLANDISNTTTTQVPQIGVSDGGLFGWLGINSPGSTDVQNAAIAALNQLATYVLNLYAELEDSATPLTAQQIAKMKALQSEVVDERSFVQSTISDLDWSFGDLVGDSISAARNIADKAVKGGANLLGLSWTQVQILGAVVAGVVVYAIYRRVAGR